MRSLDCPPTKNDLGGILVKYFLGSGTQTTLQAPLIEPPYRAVNIGTNIFWTRKIFRFFQKTIADLFPGQNVILEKDLQTLFRPAGLQREVRIINLVHLQTRHRKKNFKVHNFLYHFFVVKNRLKNHFIFFSRGGACAFGFFNAFGLTSRSETRAVEHSSGKTSQKRKSLMKQSIL